MAIGEDESIPLRYNIDEVVKNIVYDDIFFCNSIFMHSGVEPAPRREAWKKIPDVDLITKTILALAI